MHSICGHDMSGEHHRRPHDRTYVLFGMYGDGMIHIPSGVSLAQVNSTTTSMERLPDDPQQQFPTVRPPAISATLAQQQYTRTMRDRISQELSEVTRRLALITTSDPRLEKVVRLRAGSFTGSDDERLELIAVSERPAIQPKIERLQELKGQITRLQADLESLSGREVTRLQQGRGGIPRVDRTVQPGHKVPDAVYKVLYYLEARRIQRGRAQQARQGTFHQATARDWRRYLYRMVRQRVFFYLKAKQAQRERAIERQQRGEEHAEDSDDDLTLWNRQDQLAEIAVNPITGHIREPKKNRGNVEYKRRKRRAKKSRKSRGMQKLCSKLQHHHHRRGQHQKHHRLCDRNFLQRRQILTFMSMKTLIFMSMRILIYISETLTRYEEEEERLRTIANPQEWKNLEYVSLQMKRRERRFLKLKKLMYHPKQQALAYSLSSFLSPSPGGELGKHVLLE